MNQHFLLWVKRKVHRLELGEYTMVRDIIRDISLFKLANRFVNERLGPEIDDRSEKTEMHKTMNNVDNYTDYNKLHTNHTQAPETSTTSEHIWKKLEKVITDEDETAIAATTTTTKMKLQQQTKHEQVNPEQKLHQVIYETISIEHWQWAEFKSSSSSSADLKGKRKDRASGVGGRNVTSMIFNPVPQCLSIHHLFWPCLAFLSSIQQ